jgi:hypothetical protein
VKDNLLRILFFVSLLLIVSFVVVLANQTAQLVSLATAIAPRFGQLTLVTLLCIYALCTAVPLAIYFRLPKPLAPPQGTDAPDYQAYLRAMQSRLRANTIVQENSLRIGSEAEMRSALALLDRKAEEVIGNTAGLVFLSTAVSQNGKLDGLLVLMTQTQLVWKVAHVYNQRPTLRDMVHLYGNVAATAFVTTSLSDVDLSQQIQPVVASLLGSALSAVPGLTVATNILASSLLQGAANAFLTLRVGAITRRYCGSLVFQERRLLRRSASAEAVGLLGGIVLEGTRNITAAFVEATRLTMHDVASGTGDALRNLGSALKDAVGRSEGQSGTTM